MPPKGESTPRKLRVMASRNSNSSADTIEISSMMRHAVERMPSRRFLMA